MEHSADLIRAIATLLWPVLAFLVLVVYRKDLRRMLARVLKLRIFGQEVELDKALDQLQASTEVEFFERPIIQSAEEEDVSSSSSAGDDLETRILEEAGRSPRAALMLLAAELESMTREVLAASGWLPAQRRPLSLSKAIRELDAIVGLARGPLSSLSQFMEIRNMIVHGRAAVSDAEILRAIDLGLAIARAISAVPHETHWVAAIELQLFKDAEGNEPVDIGTGLKIRSVNPAGTSEIFQIFPTTLSYFRPGMKISWEWSISKTWPECWYLNPDTGEIEQAFVGSMEFVGRDIESI